jgi:hypothetical protein
MSTTYVDDANRDHNKTHNVNLREMMLRTDPYKGKVVPLRTYSLDAARMVLDGSLDYV